jgi:hypothetical protein
MKKVTMPTPELKSLLLGQLPKHHDHLDVLQLCVTWDIPFEEINNYSLYLPSSQTPVPDSKVDLYTQPDGYNKPRLRTNNRISNFG